MHTNAYALLLVFVNVIGLCVSALLHLFHCSASSVCLWFYCITAVYGPCCLGENKMNEMNNRFIPRLSCH